MRPTTHKALVVLLSLVATASYPSAQQAPAAASSQSLDPSPGDVKRGAAEFARCVNCHGPQADGAFGPDLAGTALTWIGFKKAVREPWGVMPMFTERQKSDQARPCVPPLPAQPEQRRRDQRQHVEIACRAQQTDDGSCRDQPVPPRSLTFRQQAEAERQDQQ